MTHKSVRITLMALGLACLVAAGGLLVYTQVTEANAQRYSSGVVSQFADALTASTTQAPVAQLLSTDDLPVAQSLTVPDNATVEIQGEQYIGLLSVPQLGLELPVHQSWSYPLLNQTPCVFTGTIAGGDLMIAAHNYTAHFGNLHLLSPGDTVSLLDANGTLHTYELTQTLSISGTDLESLEAGDWDLTLFTCLYGNNTKRVVLRFDAI